VGAGAGVRVHELSSRDWDGAGGFCEDIARHREDYGDESMFLAGLVVEVTYVLQVWTIDAGGASLQWLQAQPMGGAGDGS
jgi:hypothetical protein